MNAGAVVFGLLANQTTAAERVYPLLLPESPTMPALSYQQVSAVQTHAMGTSGAPWRIRLQLDVWGRTYADVRGLAAEAFARLNRYRGSVAGVEVLDVLLDNERETYEMDVDLRRVTQDYTLFLSE